MLLEYGVKNFFSFKEESSLSFRLDANCPPAISLGRDFSTVLCVKGANASGKTQMLKVLAFLKFFCTESFSSKPEDVIGVSPFFNNPEPCEFFVEFCIDDLHFRYELLITRHQVLRETLYRSKGRRVKLLERVENELHYRINTLAALDNLKLRKNVSIIAIAHQYELAELELPFRFFDAVFSNVGFIGHLGFPIGMDVISKLLAEDAETFEFVKEFIKDCDVGIADIRIVSFQNKAGEVEYFPQFLHYANGGAHAISDVMESSGTRSLFCHLAAYKLVRDMGGVLVMDEFDMNLHPHILPKLLNLFLDPQQNPNHAQFIFSTHDSEIMNLLGRYRVYLVQKEDNESFTFRLDEIPGDILRNDRPIRPAYNDGKIGGVPFL